jgi:hypothetical protein
MLTCLLLAACGAPMEDTAEVKKLLKERVDVLRSVVEARQQGLKMGIGTVGSLAEAYRELTQAELEAADTPAKRMAALLEGYKRAAEVERRVERMFEAGDASRADAMAARAARIKAEIELRRAGGAPPKEAKKEKDER